MSCTNSRDKVHFLFWSSSVAQFSNEQRNPRSPHSWPNYALPQPFSYVFNRASPFFFFFLWLVGFLQRFLSVFPQLSHPHTCTRPFIFQLGPNPASHLPVFSPSQNCNEPYSLFSHQNSLCTPGSRKTDLSPLSLQFPLGAPCLSSLMPCWYLQVPHTACVTLYLNADAWVTPAPPGQGAPAQVCGPVCLWGHGPKAAFPHRAPSAAGQHGKMRNQKGGSTPHPDQHLYSTHVAWPKLQVLGDSLPTDSKCMLHCSFFSASHCSFS